MSVVLVSVLFLLIPFLAALLDGSLPDFLQEGEWRKVLSPTTITVYIWIISPLMARASENVLAELRPLIELDDEQLDDLVQAAERVNPWHELLAITVGLLVGLASVYSSGFTPGWSWLRVYWLISSLLMYAILAWTIYISVTSTRLNAFIHDLPLKINILNPQPFESVGRQSLLLALVFIGGITLSLVFTYEAAQLSLLEFWVSNLLLVVFSISIFFISMRPTHQVLAAEKKRLLDPLTQRINTTCQELVEQLQRGEDPGEIPGLISALAEYEKRLMVARTWPYNVTILRTLFFSVFIPLVSILARFMGDILFP